MRKFIILTAIALYSVSIAGQDSSSSAMAVVDSTVVLNADSQQTSIPSVQNPSAVPDTTASSSPENSSLSSADTTGVLSNTSIVDTASPQTKSAVIQEIEEDLFLDGGEENIIAPAAASAPALSAPQTADSTITQNSTIDDTTSAPQDTLAEQQKQFLSHYPTEAMPTVDQESKPLIIEKTQSINFAKNFKEYRSPKVAILLSLLIPGAGQAYSHHKLKTGIFGGVEAAFIIAGSIVAYQGNRAMKNARTFADDWYSIDSLANYYAKLKNRYKDDVIFNVDSQIFISYIDYETFLKEAGDKSQSYYNYISHEVSPYIQGWKDVTPRFDASFDPIDNNYFAIEDSAYLVYFVNEQGDTSTAQYGFSKLQETYNDRLSKANSYFRWSKSLFTMLLINHIVSAVDAGITAKAFNDKLLGKSTLWQKFNLKETIVSTPGGPAQGFSLEVRF